MINNRMTAGIIGLGLIGGSVGYLLKKKYGEEVCIWGVDKNKDYITKALELKIIDKAADTIKDIIDVCDIIVIAAPVDATVTIAQYVLDNIKPSTTVMDVSSIKTALSQAIHLHSNRKCFVSTHPMWGTEHSGPTAAQQNAFYNKTLVICDPELTDKNKLKIVEDIFAFVQMKIVYMNSIEHDMHTAYISHISHITSFALAHTVLEKEKEEEKIFQLAASGFESTVRLSKSSADTWTPIFLNNKNNILEVLTEHITQLEYLKKCILNENKDKIYDYITQANRIKKVLKE